MKKVFSYLLALTAIMVFTACNNDDPVNKQSFSGTINNRLIDGNEITFSQGTASAEVDYTNKIIKITTSYKDANGETHNITTPEMKMSLDKTGTNYSFNNANTSSLLEGLTGNFDLATGSLWFRFTVDGATVVSSNYLLYAYVTTTVTNPDNNFNYSHEASAYWFLPDATGETCSMQISNFAPNINGSVQAATIEYKGLKLTPTATGYTVSAAEVESSYSGYYTITDLNFVLDGDGRIIDGSFKCADLDFKVAGYMFPSAI